MKPLYAIYTILSLGLFAAGFPPFYAYTRLKGRYRTGLKERLGFIHPDLDRKIIGRPRIWIHAVSLGEMKVASAIIASLKKILPECAIIMSTTTEHGRELGKDILGNEMPILFAPVDTLFAVRKSLSRLRPDVMVFLETEIWPTWIAETHGMGIKTALINGRISARSIRYYIKFRAFFREILGIMDVFSMISRDDATRLVRMGAPAERIVINGNAKYDSLPHTPDPGVEARMRRLLDITPGQDVIVAGSTRGGEESLILDAYDMILKQFPDTVLVMAPRHTHRTRDIESLLKGRGIRYHLRTDLDKPDIKRTAPVVLVNTFGELFSLYSVGTINFCGASLVPLGGQSPLEAAAWGKAVFYGPYMDDFKDAKALLEESGAGIPVSSPEELAEKAIWYLSHMEDLKATGNRAWEAVKKNQGAAEKHARVITRLLSRNINILL